MKHVMYGEKSLLMDDESAEALIEYAAAIGDRGAADTVHLKAVGDDGNEVEVDFLVNTATVLVVETASANLDVPANPDAVRAIRRKIELLTNPPPARPEFPPAHHDIDHEFDFDQLR